MIIRLRQADPVHFHVPEGSTQRWRQIPALAQALAWRRNCLAFDRAGRTANDVTGDGAAENDPGVVSAAELVPVLALDA